jgi:hypothetical protein
LAPIDGIFKYLNDSAAVAVVPKNIQFAQVLAFPELAELLVL